MTAPNGQRAGSFVASAGVTLGGQTLVAALVFGTHALIARWLGPTGNGAFHLSLVMVALAVYALNFGLGSSNVYYVGRGSYPVGRVVGTSAAVVAAVAAMSAFGAGAAWRVAAVRGFFDANGLTGLQVGLAALAVPAWVGLLLFNGIVLGQERFVAYSAVNVTRALLLLLVALALVPALGLDGALAALLASYAGALALNGWVVRRGLTGLPRPDVAVLKASARYGRAAYLGNLMQLLSNRIVILFVDHFLGVEAVGLFAPAMVVAEGVWLLSGAAGTVLFPRVAAGGADRANRLTPQVTRSVLLLVAAAAGGLALVADALVPLVFGPEYRPAVVPLWWLLPGIVFLSVPKMLSNDLAGRGHPELGAWSAAAALAATVPLAWMLIPAHGLAGAAAAASMAYAVAATVVLIAFRRLSGVRISDTLLIRRGDLARCWALVRGRAASGDGGHP